MEQAANTVLAYGTFWALVPALVAIILALVSKEVYSSLFVGIVVGGLLLCQGSGSGFFDAVFKNGLIAKVADPYNVGILVFLVMLGAMVALMNRAGGSAAFGNWAKTHIKSKVGAQIATICFGILIFIDDYFNCLTVGSVMRPVTDRFKVSHEKLSYLIDSTAAPICIIAPISSWAAAVSGFVEGEDGLTLFIKAIPFNFYALLTIFTLFLVVLWNVNIGPMKKYEVDEKSDARLEAVDLMETKGGVLDLVIPIASLIVFCVLGMIYTGGFFASGDAAKGFVDAFASSDASVGLAIGSFGAFIFTVCFYMSRRVLRFNHCMACLPDGFKAMVPAILILALAWTLKGTTDALGAKEFVAGLVKGGASGFMNFMPAIIFVIAAFLAFATGTSWGTFGILIPIVVAAFGGVDYSLMVISISACMAGAVCGDHSSPISDTTIMASAGAECNHVNHVNTQIPYVLVVAAISFVTYIVAGLTRSAILSLLFGLVLTFGTLILIKKRAKKNG
jgi:Na+/H+ antiporter NhaC